MKVIAVTGSPHPQGPSVTLTNCFIEGAKSAGHEVAVYDVNALNIRGCQGCGACKKQGVDCIIQDDLANYWKDLHECGALIVSGPNYCAQLCGPLITYMNRHYCLLDGDWQVRVHEGIKLFGVFSQGHGDPQAYQEAYRWFLHDFEARKMQLCGAIVHTGKCTEEDFLRMQEQAREWGRNL